ncbi:MAG: hypothetical protein Q7S40_25615 [Opitutaceae bacterium]|nr:hypothetical protein [Opitutaceae bacterium]
MCYYRRTFVVTALLTGSVAFADPIIFADNFSRPDSPTVGNGWLDLPADGRTLSIVSERATFAYPAGHAAIYRPLSFGDTTIVDATFTGGSGFGGSPYRYDGHLSILSDGTHNVGYRLGIARSDSGSNNSNIALFDGTTLIGQFSSLASHGVKTTDHRCLVMSRRIGC